MADEATPVEAPAPTPSLMDEAVTPPASEAVIEGEATPVEGEKPAEEAPAEGEKPEGEENEKPEGEEAAIEYEDFVAPEGVTLEPETLEAFKAQAKELKLDQASAQKFVDMAVELQQKNATQFAQQLVDYRAGLRESVKTDEEIGGPAMTDKLKVAVAAREQFGTPALKELLDESGLGDHPEVIRFFYRVGTQTGDHTFINPGKPVSQGGFYDHPTSKPKS
jgi:hypothetical protein